MQNLIHIQKLNISFLREKICFFSLNNFQEYKLEIFRIPNCTYKVFVLEIIKNFFSNNNLVYNYVTSFKNIFRTFIKIIIKRIN